MNDRIRPGDVNTGGKHKYPETEYWLVKDGVCDYEIVLPDSPERDEIFARDELELFLKKSTGASISTTIRSGMKEGGKYIVLGNTAKARKGTVKRLKNDFYFVKVTGGNVYISGGDAAGVLYGAYAFLRAEIGFTVYGGDCIVYDRDIKDLRLYDIDETDGPDFSLREPNYGPVWNNLDLKRRMRYSDEIWIKEKGHFIHNSFDEYFPREIYGNTHPEYYSDGGDDPDALQLCYTGHGSEKTVREMQDIVVKRIKELVNKKYNQEKYIRCISFTQEDVRRWCRCPHCEKLKEKYGDAYASASVIRFLNPVAREIKRWMKEQWNGRDLNIVIFAYHATIYAPVKMENGKYVPIDASVKPESNIGVLFAPIDMNYHYGFDYPANNKWRDIFKKWSAICGNLFLWVYSNCVTDYFIWTDTFGSMQPIYKKAKKLHAKYIFDQSRYNANVLTAFDNLKMYLNSRLQWHVDENTDRLIDDFMSHYFGPAGKIMKEFFDDYRAHMEKLRKTSDVSGYIFQTPVKEYYPKEVLLRWLKYIDAAFAAIKPLYTKDAEEYEHLYERIKDYVHLYDRINKESLAIRFHLLEFYRDTYPEEEAKKLKIEFISDAEKYGFELYAEYQSLDSVTGKW